MAVLPFFVALLIPLSAAMALSLDGPWRWATVILVFGITPVLDAVLGLNTRNPAGPDPSPMPHRDLRFDFLLWFWATFQVAILVAFLAVTSTTALSVLEWVGLVLSIGIASGAGGINVAHELMHRRGALERGLAEVLMTSVCYPHFCVEHIRGHHKTVATPHDPATSRLGESLYRFWPRTIAGSLVSAWKLEGARVTPSGRAWTATDRRLRYPVVVILLLGGVTAVFGLVGLAAFVAQAAVAVLLLEAINFVEHYGLVRRELKPGRFERVTPLHSWNAGHRLTNWYLFNLQRHADHHAHANRPYWLLRHIEASPQLPAGYATMALLALVPPLWRRIMDPRVESVRSQHAELDAATA